MSVVAVAEYIKGLTSQISKGVDLYKWKAHFTRKGINCNEKPHEHVRYQKNTENLLISTWETWEKAIKIFLNGPHQ